MIINYFALKKHIENCGITDRGSWQVIRDIRKMDRGLKKEFGEWYKRGKTPACSVDGIDFKTLTETFRMNEVNAFLTLDWLLKEPEEAKRALCAPLDTIVGLDELEFVQETEASPKAEEDTSDIQIPEDENQNAENEEDNAEENADGE